MRVIFAAIVLAAVACGEEQMPIPRPDAAVVEKADAASPDAIALQADAESAAPDALVFEPDAAAAPDAALVADDAASGPRLYPEGVRHSPIDEPLAAELRAVAARGADRADDVFAKIGDSITVSTSFMNCFAGVRVDLAGRDALAPTIAYFLAGDAAGTNPYVRESAAAGVGWSANYILMNNSALLRQELDAIHPRFAALMYGTNDVGFRDYDAFARNMVTIVDTLIAEGTIPVLSSIPPRDDDAMIDARVPAFGGVVRALAISRSLPFVDYHRELLPIPRHGLAGDGVHPQAAPSGSCVFTPAGLEYAANVRNLLVIEALDRMRRAVIEGEAAPDAIAPRLRGQGTRADPYVVPSLPFSASADTRTQGTDEIDRWTACSMTDESGPEIRYRITLAANARVTATVASGTGADLDVHLVRASAGAEGCVARDNREASAELTAGDWDVVVDTYAGQAGELFLYVR